jgi:hypothetical protein
LAAFFVMPLQQVYLWEQCIGDFRREVVHAQVVSEGLAAFWMVCAARVSLRQIIRFTRSEPFAGREAARPAWDAVL